MRKEYSYFFLRELINYLLISTVSQAQCKSRGTTREQDKFGACSYLSENAVVTAEDELR